MALAISHLVVGRPGFLGFLGASCYKKNPETKMLHCRRLQGSSGISFEEIIPAPRVLWTLQGLESEQSRLRFLPLKADPSPMSRTRARVVRDHFKTE